MSERSLCHIHFLIKAQHSLLTLRTPDSTSALCLAIILNRNHQQKATLTTTEKPKVYRVRAESRRQGVALFDLSWKRAHQVTVFGHYELVCERPQELRKY